METVYLISERTLRNNSVINANVESSFINAAIEKAQDINLQEVIGTALYESIKGQVKNNDFKAPEYKILLDRYIQNYLINQVMSDIIIPLHYKFRNAGLVINADQHYQSANMNEVDKVVNYYEHQAVFYANRIKEYILSNKDVFDIEICTCNEDWLQMNGKTNKCPIFFKK